MTNISPTPLDTTFINVDIPAQSSFIAVQHSNPKWYGGSPHPDAPQELITLFSPEIIEPGEVFIFDMIVEVVPENEDQVALETYNVTDAEGEIIASGQAIQLPIFTPTPTPQPTNTPFPTFTPTLSLTPLPPESRATTAPTLAKTTSVAVANETEIKPSATATVTTVIEAEQSSISRPTIIIAIVMLATIGIFVFIGIFRFLKR